MVNQERYIYGSAAPAYRPDPQREIRKERGPQRAPHRVPKKKVDKVAVLIATATFAIAFFVCFSYLQKQFQSTYLSKNIVSLENEIVELEKQNAAASDEVKTSSNLKRIYKKATKELGMVSAKNSQVFSYKSKKSNQIRQYADIPE